MTVRLGSVHTPETLAERLQASRHIAANLSGRELQCLQMRTEGLSYQEIGPAAMLSRAQGGVVQGRVLFSLPGSPNACRLALESLIIPELGHLIREVNR